MADSLILEGTAANYGRWWSKIPGADHPLTRHFRAELARVSF